MIVHDVQLRLVNCKDTQMVQLAKLMAEDRFWSSRKIQRFANAKQIQVRDNIKDYTQVFLTILLKSEAQAAETIVAFPGVMFSSARTSGRYCWPWATQYLQTVFASSLLQSGKNIIAFNGTSLKSTAVRVIEKRVQWYGIQVFPDVRLSWKHFHKTWFKVLVGPEKLIWRLMHEENVVKKAANIVNKNMQLLSERFSTLVLPEQGRNAWRFDIVRNNMHKLFVWVSVTQIGPQLKISLLDVNPSVLATIVCYIILVHHLTTLASPQDLLTRLVDLCNVEESELGTQLMLARDFLLQLVTEALREASCPTLLTARIRFNSGIINQYEDQNHLREETKPLKILKWMYQTLDEGSSPFAPENSQRRRLIEATAYGVDEEEPIHSLHDDDIDDKNASNELINSLPIDVIEQEEKTTSTWTIVKHKTTRGTVVFSLSTGIKMKEEEIGQTHYGLSQLEAYKNAHPRFKSTREARMARLRPY